jgi:glycosyltransferase involved in cell wall biosynthesis
MTSPLVTLAIPTVNRLPYLRQSLGDVLQQDYDNLDILVSDNHSSDQTEAEVQSLARQDRRLRYRRNSVRVPITTHFNQCLAEAKGEFFVVLSDDDRINPKFVRSLAETLRENRRATVAIPTNAIIDTDGQIIRTLPQSSQIVYEGIDFVLEWLWKVHDLPVANLFTIMARTDVMRAFSYQPFARGLNCDNLIFLQMALAGQVLFCRDAIFYWRDHQGQQNRMTPAGTVDQAGHQFRRFVQTDPVLQRLILSHHPAQQKMLRKGVEQMTADTFLHEIHFYEQPWTLATLKRLLACRSTFTLFRTVLRSYLRMAWQQWGRQDKVDRFRMEPHS